MILVVPLLLSVIGVLPGPLAEDVPLALVGGTVHTGLGGEPVENATVLVRDGRIEAVGTDLELPADARAIDVSGLELTAAFLDAAHRLELDFGKHEAQQGRPADDTRDVFAGMLDANRRGVAPERNAWSHLPADAADRGDHRENGFGALVVSPGTFLLAGTAAWLAASGRPPREAVLDPVLAQFGSLTWRSGPEDYEGTDYPATLMGVMAHLRQVLLDAQHRALMADRFESGRTEQRPTADPVLIALADVVEGRIPLVVFAQAEEDIRLSLGLMDDFPGLRVILAGGREAWEVADLLADRDIPVVLDMDFPEEPEDPAADDEDDEETEEEVSLEPGAPYEAEVPRRLTQERHDLWVEQVSCASVLVEAGVPVAFGTFGRTPKELRESIGVAVEHGGLDPADALAGLTTNARRVFGRGSPGGELVPGAWAGITAWSGEPTDPESAARVVVADGVLFDLRSPGDEDDDEQQEEGDDEEAETEDEPAEETEPPATVAEVEGSETEAVGDELAEADEEDLDDDESEDESPAPGDLYELAVLEALRIADPDVEWPVELDADRESSQRTGGDVLVTGATLLTVSDRGTLEDADLLVVDGRIAALGPGLEAPEGTAIIRADGAFIAPGVIDAHAHTGIRGGINEWTRIVTPEVTIEDEVDPDNVGIYRALAGGTTSARLLHGSANAIGGRHEVVKFRWGETAPGMLFEGAPRGVKFALGENPRQANWGTGGRFPKTRMGVEVVLRRVFEEARRYAEDWQRYAREEAAGEDPDPPRRDLRLEALVGILDGEIAVHSHCYSAHEILMLMSLAEEFRFRVATFQHALEAYKVAAEIAAHGGLGASTFIDWWGFKFEAYEATPYNPALVHEAGALMSINSDSGDHIRRLHLEAAKAVKYGGVAEEDALAMVTLVPAVQLGIDDRVGSLEVGKDADFAIYSHHPFDTRTRVEKTFVDGELLFERDEATYALWEDELRRRIIAGRLAMAEQQEQGLEGFGREYTDAELRSRFVSPLTLLVLNDPNEATRAASTPRRPVALPVAIVGGTVHTMDRDDDGRLVVHPGGAVLVRNGLVEQVLETSPPVDELAGFGYDVRDASGLHVWPGLVDGGSRVGLGEISMVRQSMDVNEIGGDQADVRASTAYRPESALIPVTRVNGITSTIVTPGGQGVRGQAALMGLEGWTASDALIFDACALIVSAPRVRRDEEEEATELLDVHGHLAGGMHAEPPRSVRLAASGKEGKGQEALSERVHEAWDDLRTLFADAREYARATWVTRQRGLEPPPFDSRLQALAPYALGERPIVFEANWADQIADVLDFASAENLDVIIGGGREAWKVADRLALADVGVLVGPVFSMPPTRDDAYDATYSNAGILQRAGVKIGFRSNDAHNARNLPYQAGMAVAFGLDEDAAVYALTAGTADVLRVENAVGRLRPGLRGDVIVTDGSPLQILTRYELVLIGGRDVGLESKHTRLYERYGERLLDPGLPSR